jgi:hypothetical protein
VTINQTNYYLDMWRVTEQQHTPILTGLRALVTDRGWEVDVVPMVVGQRSVKEKESERIVWNPSRSLGLGKKMTRRLYRD